MEPEEDNHLCLRCGRTIIGLDNYVSHRQQKCFKLSQPSDSPFLSDILSPGNSNAKDLQEPSFSASDICKLSADDFFLSLNLQNIANSAGGSQRTLSTVSDNFSKFCFPTLENDLENTFSEDKEFLPEAMIHDNASIGIDSLMISSDKLDSAFKVQSQECLPNNSYQMGEGTAYNDMTLLSVKSTNGLNSFSNKPKSPKTIHESPMKEKHSSSTSIIASPQKQRISVRQAENSNTLCCELTKKQFTCPCCDLKYAFSFTFYHHLLACDSKPIDSHKGSTEILKWELLLVKNSYFSCQLCFFHSNNSTSFLEHLRSRSHCQKAAKLKNPLICLPCDVEYSSSDDMKTHFSKSHISLQEEMHPVIIAEMKRNLHCCYCLRVVKESIQLFSDKDSSCQICSEDSKFISTNMKLLTQCNYGVDKHLFSSLVKLLKLQPSTLNLEFNSCFDSAPLAFTKKVNNTFSSSKVQTKRLKKVPLIPSYANMRKNNLKCKRIKQSADVSDSESEHRTGVALNGKIKFCDNDSKKLTISHKLYLCDKCGYTSKTCHGLTKHRRYHTGEKPFKCRECGASFAVCGQLRRHRRLHTGSKPYKCPYCSYMCNVQENLRKHILKTKKHIGKKMYPCKHCIFSCNDFSDFKSHLLKEHAETFPNDKSIPSSSVAGLYETL